MDSAKYYIGWDVGGWNCDANKSSRDAIVVLDGQLQIVGKKRGNIREWINRTQEYEGFLQELFTECGITYQREEVVFAIDAPLGYSHEFVQLLCTSSYLEEVPQFHENAYLFRKTERFLYEKGFVPLSAVNHMIGSQATKGMHFISKFAPHLKSLGVWQSEDKRLIVVETYPAANSIQIPKVLISEHADVQDAYRCAVMAQVFDNENDKLYQPLKGIWEKEGWIWAIKREKDGNRIYNK